MQTASRNKGSGQAFLFLPRFGGTSATFHHPWTSLSDPTQSMGQYRIFCTPPVQIFRYCPFQGAIPAFLSTPWSKTSILPVPGGNIGFSVHPLVKNFDIARSWGQYRDFCPPPGQKLRYCPILGAISAFLSTLWSKTSILPDSRGNTAIFVQVLYEPTLPAPKSVKKLRGTARTGSCADI